MKKLDLGIRAKVYGNLFLEGAKAYVGEPSVLPVTIVVGLIAGVASKDVATGMRKSAEALGTGTLLSGGTNLLINIKEAEDTIAYYTDTERA